MDRRLCVATCSHCGALFDLAGVRSDATGRPPVPLPAKFTVHASGEALVIAWRWRDPSAYFLIALDVIWFAVLIFMYTLAWGSSSFGVIVVVSILHFAAGVWIGYKGLANLLNVTTVRVDREWLRVGHSPLPWRPAPCIAASGLEQLYVQRKTRVRKGEETHAYLLHAIMRDNQQVRILPELEDLDTALYLEQEIERRLGLRNRAVANEFRVQGLV